MEICNNCKDCCLCNNQEPMFDKKKHADIMWVGLSAKIKENEDDKPLSANTKSGILISEIEERIPEFTTYKTNIVKCPPIENGKLRYPTNEEISYCIGNLESEFMEVKPRVVFLLGNLVADAIGKHFSLNFRKHEGYDYSYTTYQDMFFVPIHHPSYIHVYKRKHTHKWMDAVTGIILEIMENIYG